jgi:MFS family permease
LPNEIVAAFLDTGHLVFLLTPLLIAAGMLLGANSMSSTLVAVRASLENMSPTLIGTMGTTYFGGYVVGAFVATRLIGFVGHIRVFSALAAIAASCALVLMMRIDPYVWIAVRSIMGFCSAALFTVVESWLNGVSTNANRGKVFSLYGLVDIGAATTSQFLLPSLGAESFRAFAVLSMLLGLSLVPIALSPTTEPQHEGMRSLHMWDVWQISPLAFAACLTIGLTNSAFRIVGPLYARGIGLDITELAIFMGAGIGGGAILQLPFGWLSDKVNRRSVLIAATLGASLFGCVLSLATGSEHRLVYAGVFLFGAFAMPLYSIAAAHANDFAKPDQYAALSAGLLFTFAVGSMIGPIIASVAIERMGPRGLFAYTSAVHLGLVAMVMIRSAVRPSLPRDLRVKHAPSIRVTPTVPPSAPGAAEAR